MLSQFFCVMCEDADIRSFGSVSGRYFMGLVFRFLMYVFIGLSLEVIFSVTGLDLAMGKKVERRKPKKYLEGFVSLFMIPVHGFGVLFLYENMYFAVRDFHLIFRYLLWAVSFAAAEAAAGFIYDKLTGFYPWDYYETSGYKIFRRGYTLWTLMPLWGLYGLALEVFVRIFVYISPQLDSILR